MKPVLAAIDAAAVHGISHITGGGFYENIPRSIPDGLCAKVDKAAIQTPPIFKMLQSTGGISEHDMFNTYNMGVGMVVIVSRDTADTAISQIKDRRYPEKLAQLTDNLLLVGISYNKETKKHTCKIEKYSA